MNLKDTIFLPTTGFQMKGNLSVKEPELLVHWDTSNLYARQRARLKGRPKFCLHDGPPFANGAPHVGHALNKVIKDIVIRFKQMSGYDAPLIPGWDCHGLPIEWKIEQKLKEEGRSRDMVSAVEFRMSRFMRSRSEVRANAATSSRSLSSRSMIQACLDFR